MTENRKDKIKVLRVIARLNIGGPAIHTVLLSEGLDPALFDTHLAIGTPEAQEGDMFDFARERDIKVTHIPGLKRGIGFHDMPAFFKLFKLIKQIKPDIIHTHTAKAGALGRLAAAFARVPVKVHTFHGHVFDGYFSPFKARFFLLIERLLSHTTTRAIVVSEGVRNEIVERLHVVPGDKCVVIRLGLELEKFLDNEKLKGTLRNKLDVGSDTLLVGIVGRLVPIKNHVMFLKAARKLKDENPELKVKFLIVGDGEMKGYLAEYRDRLGLGSTVIFTGWIRDLAAVYADLDVVALTSLNEGTPVSLIEAMASARPVIATNVGGVKDIVSDGNNGYLVGPNDVDGFSRRLAELLHR